MNNGNLYAFIRETNNNGFCYYNIVTGSFNPIYGYMVEMSMTPKCFDQLDIVILKDYIKEWIELLFNAKHDFYITSWKSENKTYLSVSYLLTDLDIATKEAKEHQITEIWDNCLSKGISLI